MIGHVFSLISVLVIKCGIFLWQFFLLCKWQKNVVFSNVWFALLTLIFENIKIVWLTNFPLLIYSLDFSDFFSGSFMNANNRNYVAQYFLTLMNWIQKISTKIQINKWNVVYNMRKICRSLLFQRQIFLFSLRFTRVFVWYRMFGTCINFYFLFRKKILEWKKIGKNYTGSKKKILNDWISNGKTSSRNNLETLKLIKRKLLLT